MTGFTKNALLCCSIASALGHPILWANDNETLNHHWSLLGDFVFIRRNDIHKDSLVKDDTKRQIPCECPDNTVMNTKGLVNNFKFEPGYRVGVSYMDNPKMSFEGNFLWIQPWEWEKEVHGNGTLYLQFTDPDYTIDFNDANEAKGIYHSRFWDLEFNYWRHFNPRRHDYFSVSAIAGLRYFSWNESFSLSYFHPGAKSKYDIRAYNNIFGAQVGGDFQMNPTRYLSWEMFAKFGVMANNAKQKTFLGDRNETVVLRNSSDQKWTIGIYTDVALQMAFQFKDHLNLHVGYEFMYFSGVALAPEQLDKQVSPGAGKQVSTGGTPILQGLFAGIVLSF